MSLTRTVAETEPYENKSALMDGFQTGRSGRAALNKAKNWWNTSLRSFPLIMTRFISLQQISLPPCRNIFHLGYEETNEPDFPVRTDARGFRQSVQEIAGVLFRGFFQHLATQLVEDFVEIAVAWNSFARSFAVVLVDNRDLLAVLVFIQSTLRFTCIVMTSHNTYNKISPLTQM